MTVAWHEDNTLQRYSTLAHNAPVVAGSDASALDSICAQVCPGPLVFGMQATHNTQHRSQPLETTGAAQGATLVSVTQALQVQLGDAEAASNQHVTFKLAAVCYRMIGFVNNATMMCAWHHHGYWFCTKLFCSAKRQQL